jgi:UDP-glucose 4-epimerase
MKILVTGGAGFVGSSLVNRLLTDYDCTVIVIDNLINGDFSRLIKSDKLIIVNDSVLNLDAYSLYLNDVDYIFHLACVQISKSNDMPMIDLETNAISTLNILEYLRTHTNTRLKKFVYTSSCSIYGNFKGSTSENSPPNISSMYAATKYLAENYVSLYNKQYNIPTTIVRYSNVYGYNQTPKDKVCGVIGKYIYNAIHDMPLVVFGDGKYTRDYTFIDDAVDATLLTAFNDISTGNVYNISTNISHSVMDIIEIIKKYYPGLVIEYNNLRDIDNITDRLISYDRLMYDFNWSPKYQLLDGIEKTINWFTDNV